MRYERNLVDQIRSTMSPGNPVPGGAREHIDAPEAQERLVALHCADITRQQQQARRTPRGASAVGRRRTRRLLAPAAAAVAVLAVIAGLTIASGTASRHAGGAAAGGSMPRYYVALKGFPPDITAVVRDSLTGRALTSVKIPASYYLVPAITAAANDRTFFIASAPQRKDAQLAARLYMLRVAAGGHSATLTRLPIRLLPAATSDGIDGVALSPDGTELAVAIQIPTSGFRPLAEITVFPLSGGPVRTWKAPRDFALVWDPAWIDGGKRLSFLLQDHIKGTVNSFTSRSQVRILDPSAPGNNLLASRVLATGGGKLGYIQTAVGAPGSGTIVASVYRNVPAAGRSGTATLRVLALSTSTGRVVRVFSSRTVPYRSRKQLNAADSSCTVFSVDPTGRHVLVSCPSFGRLDNGRFTPLPKQAAAEFGYWAAW